MQLLSACGVCERVDGIFDLVPLDEALRWSLCWSSREAAGQRAAAGWRGWAGAAGKLQGRGRRRVLQSRGSLLVCSVCTVDNNADIDAGWRHGRPDLGLNLGLDHVDHDT